MTSSSSVRSASAPGRARGHDPAQRLGQPLRPQRLEQVVDRAQVERVDRPVVVRGDEHDRRRDRQPAQRPGDVQPVECRASGCPGTPRRRRRRAAAASPRPRRRRRHGLRPGGRRRAGSRARPARAARRRPRAPAGAAVGRLLSPPARSARLSSLPHAPQPSRALRTSCVELRDAHAHLRTRAGGGLDHQTRTRRRTPTAAGRRCCPARRAPPLARRAAAALSGSIPTPSSSTLMRQSGAGVLGHDRDRPTPVFAASPCRTAFSTSGWTHRNGTATGSTSGAICSRTSSRSPNRARSSVR